MAKELVSAVYRVCERGRFSTDFGLRDQIRRASVSVMSNIAEGFERGSRREFKRKFQEQYQGLLGTCQPAVTLVLLINLRTF